MFRIGEVLQTSPALFLSNRDHFIMNVYWVTVTNIYHDMYKVREITVNTYIFLYITVIVVPFPASFLLAGSR